MKLAISNIAWSEEYDRRAYELMEEYGFTGLEIAPTRIFPQTPYEDISKAHRWASELKCNYGFSVASIQSIWYGRKEKLFGSTQERKQLLEYTCKAVDFAAAIECKNVVFGCPKNRIKPESGDSEIAEEFFYKVGEYAHKNGTVIAIEANPTIYGTNYINTTAEAISLVRKVNSDGFLLNLDIGTMVENGENTDALKGSEGYINHVHISEPFLSEIRQRELHAQIAAFLHAGGYNGYISVEMGCRGNENVLENVLNYTRNVMQ